jgi:hypothetical protein
MPPNGSWAFKELIEHGWISVEVLDPSPRGYKTYVFAVLRIS